MKIWVDDLRPAPTGYQWVRSVEKAKMFIANRDCIHGDETYWHIDLIDLDHDAGDFACEGGDYIEILKWMEQEGINNIPIRLHTMNPVGRENMRAIIRANNWKEVL